MRNLGPIFRNITILAALIFVCVPAPSSATSANVAAATEPEVRSEMLVSTEWLAEHLTDEDVVVLCIAGQRDFYTSGHIPGARLIMLGDIAVTRNGVPNELPSPDALKKVFESAGVSDTSRIVIYGGHSGLLAARAYWTLDYLGAGDHAALLDGGLEKWNAEGRPLSQDAPQAGPGQLSLVLNPDVLVTVKDVQDFMAEVPPSATLIDARPADEFSGGKISEDVARAGHIPGAHGLYWMRNIESAANPVLVPEQELRQMYAEAGASQGRRVVTYCRTGMQSSFDYFVAKYLSYNAAVYDGSFYEWSRKGLPVEGDGKTEIKPEVKK